jgi:hypothetical protein
MLMNKSEDKCGVGINILSGYLSTFTIYIYIYIYIYDNHVLFSNKPKAPSKLLPTPTFILNVLYFQNKYMDLDTIKIDMLGIYQNPRLKPFPYLDES